MIILKLKPTFLNNILYFDKGACPLVFACIVGLIMLSYQNTHAQNSPKKEEKKEEKKPIILKDNQKDTLKKDLKNTPKDNLKINDTIPPTKISPKKPKKGFKSPFGRLEFAGAWLGFLTKTTTFIGNKCRGRIRKMAG